MGHMGQVGRGACGIVGQVGSGTCWTGCYDMILFRNQSNTSIYEIEYANTIMLPNLLLVF